MSNLAQMDGSASTDSSYTPKLSYGNYEEWRRAIIPELKKANVWKICDGTKQAPIAKEGDPPTLVYNMMKDWEQANEKAIGEIQAKLDMTNFDLVQHLTTGREVWLELEGRYQKTSVGRTYNILESLFSLPYSTNLSTFARAKSQIMSTFKASLPEGFTVDKLCNLLLSLSIIRELPDKFSSVRTNFITSSEVKISDVISALDAVQAQEDYEEKKGTDLVDALSVSIGGIKDQPIPLRTYKCQLHSSNGHTFAECQEYKLFQQYKQEKSSGRGAFGQRGRGGRGGRREGLANRSSSQPSQRANVAQEESVDQSANFAHYTQGQHVHDTS